MAGARRRAVRLGAHPADVERRTCVNLALNLMGDAPLRADGTFDGAARAFACAAVALYSGTPAGLKRSLMFLHMAALFLRVDDNDSFIESVAAALWGARDTDLAQTFGALLVLE